jgi:hypothetical protein
LDTKTPRPLQIYDPAIQAVVRRLFVAQNNYPAVQAIVRRLFFLITKSKGRSFRTRSIIDES